MRKLALAVFLALSASAQPQVREEQTIAVDGARETWRLEWAAPPEPYCEPSDASLTCPCTGFAYGEAGDLFLLRLRDGRETERLHLTPFFTEDPGKAVIQRWPADFDRDFKNAEREDFPSLVRQRPVVRVMRLGDYDHDGRATEFYLQTEALPCGKSFGVVIGVSKLNPRLHVFGAASNPGAPLYMQKRGWEALRRATGPVDILDWQCEDHAAGAETRLRIHWTAKGIEGVRRRYTCPPEPRRPISQEPL